MPVISTRRYSNSSGSSYLPPSVGGTTSSLSNLGKNTTSSYSSNYRSSSLSNSTYSSGYSSGSSYLPRTSSYRAGLYTSSSSLGGTTSSYRPSSYLTGGNNDTSAASRFGVSSNKYTRSSSDRDTRRITGKTQHNNNINTTVSNRIKPLQSKPPISGSYRSSLRLSEGRSEQVTSKSDQNCNYNNSSNCNDSSNNSKFASSTAGQPSTGQDQITNNTTKISSSLSSSSLARQVATSGLELYEKYSPVHYIPKCELSRSRSLSEATTNKYNNDNNLSNSSSNVHQLLHQKEVNKLQDSKECKTTTTTSATTTSSPSSSSKDISTAQLASKVKRLFAADQNTATNNFIETLNASSIVVLNNCYNNNHSQADANKTPNQSKIPLQTDSSTALSLSDLTDICIPSSSASDAVSVVDIVDIVDSAASINNISKNIVLNNCHCTHYFTNRNHQEQAIQTCSNCNKTTATILGASSPQSPKILKTKFQLKTQSNENLNTIRSNKSATVVSINTSFDPAECSSQSFEDIRRKFQENSLNLQTTKQLLNKKSDDNRKTMQSNFYAKRWAEQNYAGVTGASSVTVTYHTSTTTVTIQSPNTVTTVNANSLPPKTTSTNKSNLYDFHLEFSKHDQAGRALEGTITTTSNTAPLTSQKEGSTKGNNSSFYGQNLISTFKDQNFLKNECAIARSQVINLNSEEDSQKPVAGIFSTEENNNNTFGSIKNQSKNVIKPLVHKTQNKLTSVKVVGKTVTNNNMNCLLDDIKYIDSDDSERQQNSQSKSLSNSSSSSSSSSAAASNFNHLKIVNSSSSTLPLTSKQRDLINSDNSTKATATNKFNTLNDFKRIPTSVRSTSNFVTSTKLSSSTASASNISSRISSLTNSKPKSASTGAVAVSNNISSSSRESTPPNSPQMLRRGNLHNGNSNLTQQQQNIPEHTLSSSSSILNDKKLSNKLCDIDESVRDASIRSALPPSPTPSRYWDRGGRLSSGLSGRYNDIEDSTSKSALNSSESFDKGSVEGLCGLRNIGNTCFMNSVIQCLSHTRELTKFLKTQTSVRSSSKDQQILYEFAKLIREMWSPNCRSVTPLELKSAFSSKHRMYSGYNQQDAQEFLRFFLDSLHCALNSGTKGEHLKIDDGLSDNRKADLTWEWYSKIENSVIRDLFVGQLKSTLKCTVCGNTSVTFDPFWDLSVPLPSSSRCKLDSCLELFIREEILDGDEMPTCSKCQTRRKCTKSFTIQRFPKYLVIHLKRFSETRWSKLSNIVEFPTGERELNMAPYAANPSSQVPYSLYAISNHMGSTAGGHYVALCKHPNTKKWHEFNDNVVSDALSDNVLVSSSAYLLFYERA